MITRELLAKMSRLAAKVKRYHCWPTIQGQTIGDHTFNNLRIWWLIWGDPPSHITGYIIWHDMGEYRTGDPPFPFKANHPDIKSTLDAAEEDAVEFMGGPRRGQYYLTPTEKHKAKICDLLEMMEFGQDEFIMGNRYALPIVEDTRQAALKLVAEMRDFASIKGDPDMLKDGHAVVAYVNHRDKEFLAITGIQL